MGTSRFIALHPGDEAESLLRHHPNAFLLLAQIAMRAKWKDDPVTGLKAGQALIGDYQNAGIPSRKAYRHAQKILIECGFGAFKGANKGTIATLTDQRIFSITIESGAIKGATEGPSKGHRRATNHSETQNTQSTLFALDGQSPCPPQAIAWSPEIGFTGITDMDQDEWKRAFPAIDIDREVAAASVWLKNNPAKRKKLPGRFLTNWFARSQERGGSAPSNPKPNTTLPPKPGTISANGRTYRTS